VDLCSYPETIGQRGIKIIGDSVPACVQPWFAQLRCRIASNILCLTEGKMAKKFRYVLTFLSRLLIKPVSDIGW